jgi:hypothetical protein
MSAAKPAPAPAAARLAESEAVSPISPHPVTRSPDHGLLVLLHPIVSVSLIPLQIPGLFPDSPYPRSLPRLKCPGYLPQLPQILCPRALQAALLPAGARIPTSTWQAC